MSTVTFQPVVHQDRAAALVPLALVSCSDCAAVVLRGPGVRQHSRWHAVVDALGRPPLVRLDGTISTPAGLVRPARTPTE